MRYAFYLFLLLTGFWVVNSQDYTGLTLFFGLLSIALVLLITYRMKLLDQESVPIHLFTRIGPFYIWLIKEITVGSFYVIKTILKGGKAISPNIVTIEFDLTEETNRVILANSITLVPGTLSVRLKSKSIQAHSLTEELADALITSELLQRVKRLES